MNQKLYDFVVNQKAHRALRHDYVDNGELAADYASGAFLFRRVEGKR